MKLYMYPASMTSRPVRLFIAENGIDCEEQLVDIFAGEQHKEPFSSLNPNRLVPVLVDGDLRITESSAILKYLADKIDSPAYPKDLKQRATVNERMDWINTNFYRDYGYNLIYPQLMAHHQRASEEGQRATLAWGQEKSRVWLKILDEYWLGPKNGYLCGPAITIADYFGACIVTLGELIRCDFSAYPNVQRWIHNVKQLRSWPQVNEAFYGLAQFFKDRSFVTF